VAKSGVARSGSCRIIGGVWRGRKISFDDAKGLRPTTDRIRETVFNWLQFELANSVCLDCFAGSGAMGFEAASRGAASVVMLDNNRATVANLKANIGLLVANTVQLEMVDTLRWLQQTKAKQQAFDIVFIDPPYQSDLLEKTCEQLEKGEWLRAQTKIYLEHAVNDKINTPPSWTCLKSKQAGQVAYKLFSKESL